MQRLSLQANYAAAAHIGISRQTVDQGWVENAVAALGLKRDVMTTVSGFATAIAVARASDMVATVPEQHTAALRVGMNTFALPFELPSIVVSMLWRPRVHADPARLVARMCTKDRGGCSLHAMRLTVADFCPPGICPATVT